MTKTDTRLCVVSSDGRNWHALSYGNRGDRNISFKIRTYLPDHLDDRITPFKSAKTLLALAQHLTGKNHHSPVIAKVVHVQELTGWKDKDFAPVI